MNRARDKAVGGFTLMELLVAVAIMALLLAILIPSLASARLKAKVVKVHAELRGICMAIDQYHREFEDYPLAQSFCAGESANLSQYFELPAELFAGHYLSGRAQYDGRHEYVRFRDPFDPSGNSYKYIKPGVGRGNHQQLTSYRIWVPEAFPGDDGQDICYPTYKRNPDPDAAPNERWIVDQRSPVAYAVWSCGTRGPIDWLTFQESQMSDGSHLPVPPRTWNTPTRKGIVCHLTTSKHYRLGASQMLMSP